MNNDPIWNRDYVLAEMPPAADTEAEVAFLIQALELEPGERVLDVGCGAGRHVRPLAEYGCWVVGVDRSAELLRIAGEQVRHPNAYFCRADMRRLPFRETFDVAICLFATFGLLDETGNRQALRSIAASLRQDGVCLIETWNPYLAATLDGSRNWWRVRNRFYLAEARFDPLRGTVADHRTILDLQTKTADEWTRVTRFYTPPELTQMAAEAGLRPMRWFGDFDGSELTADSPRVIVALQKEER